MPIDYKQYPPDWPEVSRHIRHNRANGRCECKGECGRGHGRRCIQRQGDPCPSNPAHKVVLTVAHLDFENGPCQCKKETGQKCSIEAHLKAMCQGCHLRLDSPSHVRHAARTRKLKLEIEGQDRLWPLE